MTPNTFMSVMRSFEPTSLKTSDPGGWAEESFTCARAAIAAEAARPVLRHRGKRGGAVANDPSNWRRLIRVSSAVLTSEPLR